MRSPVSDGGWLMWKMDLKMLGFVQVLEYLDDQLGQSRKLNSQDTKEIPTEPEAPPSDEVYILLFLCRDKIVHQIETVTYWINILLTPV